MTVRDIIDKRALEAIVARTKRSGTRADFLLERLCVDLGERLDTHRRKFAHRALISPWSNYEGFKFLEAEAFPDSVWIDERFSAQPDSFDLVVDVVNLHRINDVPGMLVQYNRALKPDGLFIASVPGGDSLTELRQSLAHAETELFGGLHPRVLPFMDVRDAGGLLQRAGYALPVTDVDSVVVRYDTMFDLMLDIRAMGETSSLIDRPKNFTTANLFERAANYYAENFSDPDGRIRATFSFIWMSGWAPDPSQQKPLKPGTATHSLADALKVQRREG